jgi:hypothetical protein
VRQVILLTVCLMLAVGCGSQVTHPTGGDELVMAEKAKAALVALARANPKMFEGMDPDRLQAVPIKSGEETHTYRLGAFEINVEKRWYNADIGNDVWHQWYDGTFTVDAAGRWHASRPNVTYADK